MVLEKLMNTRAGKSGSVSTYYLIRGEGVSPGNKVVSVQTVSKCQGGVIHTGSFAYIHTGLDVLSRIKYCCPSTLRGF